MKDESLSQNGPQLCALQSNGPTPEGSSWGDFCLCFEKLFFERELSAYREREGGY